MRIRLRGPNGASTLSVEEDATVADLRSQIRAKTALQKFDIKHGYPPRPLHLPADSILLSSLEIKLNGEQLTISSAETSGDQTSRNVASSSQTASSAATEAGLTAASKPAASGTGSEFSFSGLGGSEYNTEGEEAPIKSTTQSDKQIGLKRQQKMNTDVPEIPLPDRGATLVMRVMPDDNSCLFRALGTAILPGDDLSMTELRSLVAANIQSHPDDYPKVVLEQEPDEYCKWIQTEEAWGGGIELRILADHFGIEIVTIDVQSGKVYRWNEGPKTRCILVYSGIHYDTIAVSPYPNAPRNLDTMVFDTDDDVVLVAAERLCEKLKGEHYFTDTGGMAIVCDICKWVGYGQGQAATHAQQTGHYDMQEVQTAK